MKVFVATTLVEDIDLNSCSVAVFDALDKAQKYMHTELESYADDYKEYGNEPEIDEYENRGRMCTGDIYVTIEIEEKEVN